MSNDEGKKLTKNEWKRSFRVVGRMLLVYALIFVQGAWAGQDQKTKDKADPTHNTTVQQTSEKASSSAVSAKEQGGQTQGEESESSAAEKRSRDGSHEGIKVHGHWTIEVRNPDGTLVTHREFENAYQPGSNVLPNMLSRFFTMGSWAIEFNGSGCTSSAASCDITETGSGAPGRSSTLSVTQAGGGVAGVSVVLSGNIAMATAVQITSVWTFLGQCNASTVPSVTACASAGPLTNSNNNGQLYATFTTKDLSASPIPVASGQTVQVTVSISFS